MAHALQRLQGVNKLVEPKSRRSQRTLQLPGQALAALRDERQRQAARQLAAGPRWKPSILGLVFTDAHGAPLVGTTVTRAFVDALTERGSRPSAFTTCVTSTRC